MISDDFAQNLLETAINCGADAAEAFLSEKTETVIMASGGKPESVSVKKDQGYGIRVLLDSKLGFFSSNRLEPMKATENIRQLVKTTRMHTADPYNTLPEWHGSQNPEVREIYDPEIAEISLQEKINRALEIERYGKASDSRVSGFVWVLYGDISQSYRILSSTGIDVSSNGSGCYGFAYCYAGNGYANQTGRYTRSWGYYRDFNPKYIGETSAQYALRMLGSKDIKSGQMMAVFPPEAGIPLLHALFGMIEADSIQKGKSPFRGKIGKKVASEKLTIIDDGTLDGGLGTRPYDSEGVPTCRTLVIDKGVLNNYLYDTYTAKKGRTKSTGNASRGDYHSKPLIYPTNFYIQPGVESAEEIRKKVDFGIMITELAGIHAGINHATADFSIPAKGVMIEKGELSFPVDNISISGNLFHFLNNLTATGNDLEWQPIEGMIGAPSFLVDDLKVIGRG